MSTVVVPIVTGLFEESSRSTVIVPLVAPAVKVWAVDVILSLELTAVVVKLDVLLPLFPAASPWVTLIVYCVPPESAVETFTVQAPLATVTPENAWTGADGRVGAEVDRHVDGAVVGAMARVGRVSSSRAGERRGDRDARRARGRSGHGRTGSTVSTRTGPLVAVVVHWP